MLVTRLLVKKVLARLSAISIALLLVALPAGATPQVVSPTPLICGFGEVRFDVDFPGARLNECAQTGIDEYSIGVLPEAQPINPSPWYAFKVMAVSRRTISVYLHYGVHSHRYPPKVSQDGKTWTLLDKDSYQVLFAGKTLKLNLVVGPQPRYIAAQEVIDNRYYEQWADELAQLAYVEKSVLGKSTQDRSIFKLVVAGPGKEWVLIVGRQHPPELTGALALMPFVETLLADSDLARQFRQHFNLLIVPNLNPDGVAAGHWRYNMNGVDLNRDWGLFTQPEIAHMRDELLRRFTQTGQRLVLGLDFHSTKEDIFYTQQDATTLYLPSFTHDWLRYIERQLPDYPVNRKATNNPGLPTFKTYMSGAYSIPAITYEVGDNTDRPLITQVARTGAEGMMNVLLYAD